MVKNTIFGLSGKILNDSEKEFLKKANPYGIILFTRNIESKEQTKNLITEIKEAVGRQNVKIFIDQEGGKVARIKPPLFSRELPPAEKFGKFYDIDPTKAITATKLNSLLNGLELKEWDIDGCFAPVVDLRFKDAHDIIGNRSYGENPDKVMPLAQSASNGLKEAGVIPCLKHFPGHGRALADSHEELPVINVSLEELERTDLKPFKIDTTLVMFAHAFVPELDKQQPTTYSKKIVEYFKKNFPNKLSITDALEMKALNGSFYDRAKKAVEAGIDLLLHCNGHLSEMEEVNNASIELEPQKIVKLEEDLITSQEYDFVQLSQEYHNLMQDYHAIA